MKWDDDEELWCQNKFQGPYGVQRCEHTAGHDGPCLVVDWVFKAVPVYDFTTNPENWA